MHDLVTPLRDKINAIDELGKLLPHVDLSKQKEIEDAGLLATTDLRVEHQFSYGVYARTLYIPKGIMLTGQIHKYENLNILLKGKLQVSIGDEIKIVEPPFSVVSPANTKRVAFALEDSIWMTVIGTHERDINIIEDCFIAHNDEEYLEFAKQQLALDLKL